MTQSVYQRINTGSFAILRNVTFVMNFRWWRKREERKRLAQEDAMVLIARYGTRASHIANRRVAMMRNGSVLYNRPACHWKRVHSIKGARLPHCGILVASPSLSGQNAKNSHPRCHRSSDSRRSRHRGRRKPKPEFEARRVIHHLDTSPMEMGDGSDKA